ncbi:putative E3 ubiquitin-protein ligase [Sesbania bispinosa]|nr:putative E3 ubiquitin-protein ligase [Sesbania bispinosa]
MSVKEPASQGSAHLVEEEVTYAVGDVPLWATLGGQDVERLISFDLLQYS